MSEEEIPKVRISTAPISEPRYINMSESPQIIEKSPRISNAPESKPRECMKSHVPQTSEKKNGAIETK